MAGPAGRKVNRPGRETYLAKCRDPEDANQEKRSRQYSPHGSPYSNCYSQIEPHC